MKDGLPMKLYGFLSRRGHMAQEEEEEKLQLLSHFLYTYSRNTALKKRVSQLISIHFALGPLLAGPCEL